jgi:predicted lipoprotein with Yx(FWY)xxD motif
MTKRVLTLIAATALLGVAAGCGDDDGDDSGASGSSGGYGAPAATQEATTTAPPPAAAGTEIKAGDSQYGQVLFDGKDQAIYYFEKEKSSTSECYDACAEAWPPVLTEGDPQVGPGAQAGKLGTTQRDDGTTQVTYAGHPLYYYDEPPGAVTCHNVDEFGGLWVAVQPNGQAVSS